MVNSVLLPLEEKLVSQISTRYIYSSQILQCSSKKGKRKCTKNKKIKKKSTKQVRACPIRTEKQASANTR